MTILKDYPNYSLTKEGVLTNISTNTIKKPWLGNNGYLHVDLYHNNKSTKISMHRLMALTFIPNPNNKRVINHLDGDKTNNKLSNLEWATDSENIQHAYDTGLAKVERYFTQEELLGIFEEFKLGQSFTSLAKKYGTAIATISSNLRNTLRAIGKEDELDNAIKVSMKKIRKQAGIDKRQHIILKMIDMKTFKVIRTFNSVAEAADYLCKKSSGPITNAIHKVTKSGYGYYWISDDTDTTDYASAAIQWGSKKSSKSKSKYKGINCRKDTNKFRVTFRGKTLGNFFIEEEALKFWNSYMLDNNFLNEIQ